MEMILWSFGLGLIVSVLPACAFFRKEGTAAKVAGAALIAANLLFSWLIHYLALPAHVGPFWGLTFWVIVLCIINGLISLFYHSDDYPGAVVVHGLGTIVIAVIIIMLGIGSTMWFVDDEKMMMAGTVSEVEWADIHTRSVEANPRNIRIRDRGLAAWKAQQAVADSNDRGLGSRVSIGSGRIQKISLPDGGYEQIWVFPLEHAGFFKWLNNKTTPGYIRVSAERDEEAVLVETLDGSPLGQRYMPSARFGSDLKRHIYQAGYTNVRLEDLAYEIDDSGRPFWIVSLTKPTERYAVREVLGVLVVDPQTGDIEEYSVEDAPAWIDRIIPEEIAIERFKWHGQWQKGWINGTFAQEGVLQPTPIPTESFGDSSAYLVVGDDGNTYWTVGMTSTNTADTALDSFVMMNSRTGEIVEFRESGINEIGAMNNINDDVSLYNGVWKAAQPIPYRVYDRLVIIAPIVAEGRRLQEIAIVDVQSETMARGKTKAEALRNFALAIGKEEPQQIDPSRGGEVIALAGSVTAVGDYILGGNTHVVFAVDSAPELRFHAEVTLSRDALPLLRIGDRVSFEYVENEDDILPLRSFRIVD